jgi:AcrR family transcriptional regulator
MATNLTVGPIAAAPGPAAPARRARSAEAKDQVRQALIDAGRELLLARPSEALSLRGIARHAGYSSGVIYRYFADRDALFLAIRDSEMTNFIDRLEAASSDNDDPATRLLEIADQAFDFSRYQIAAFGMNSLFLFGFDEAGSHRNKAPVHDAAPAAARIHAFFERAVRSAMTIRANDHSDIQIAVGALMASITGAVLLPAGSDHGDFPDGRIVMRETIAALLCHWRLQHL